MIQMDADGQHDVCNIPVIYDRLRTKDADDRYPDIVLGARLWRKVETLRCQRQNGWHFDCFAL